MRRALYKSAALAALIAGGAVLAVATDTLWPMLQIPAMIYAAYWIDGALTKTRR